MSRITCVLSCVGTVKWKEFNGEERQKGFSREGGCD